MRPATPRKANEHHRGSADRPLYDTRNPVERKNGCGCVELMGAVGAVSRRSMVAGDTSGRQACLPMVLALLPTPLARL